ncbi:HET-domain-containing protein [Mollisia scopiformis]|uniref:HET-domain-containing protein n=1 Tax=Mollisia scopiformis TaxID=149040 RepID=A0A194XGQ1_MOLSC|nr:HET-domain-containing protein [Mollisia scopiformis]KUJ19316.1 HET-domain-containing protein [Mollisia scopiformis]
MAAEDSFVYPELGGGDAFRLVHLQPCENLESSVECSLENTKLADYRHDIADHYIAISYVWGDPTDRRTIMIDGKRLEITASLESALRHIRDPRRILQVWADGICIDQNDVLDRNQQVSLMGDIYSTAEHTIIFLGLSSPRCDAMLQWMSLGADSSESEGTPYPLTCQFEMVVEDEILARPWFTRVWILQELVLSRIHGFSADDIESGGEYFTEQS